MLRSRTVGAKGCDVEVKRAAPVIAATIEIAEVRLGVGVEKGYFRSHVWQQSFSQQCSLHLGSEAPGRWVHWTIKPQANARASPGLIDGLRDEALHRNLVAGREREFGGEIA